VNCHWQIISKPWGSLGIPCHEFRKVVKQNSFQGVYDVLACLQGGRLCGVRQGYSSVQG
jgi:hypothetical protein